MRRFEIVKRFRDDCGDLEVIKARTLVEILPQRSTKKSAGYDFINPERVEIKPKEIKYVKTGIKAMFPEDEMLMLCNRSSNPKKKGLILANRNWDSG